MKELEKKARVDLQHLYEAYAQHGSTEEVRENAQHVYDEYIPAKTLLSQQAMRLVTTLFPIAYPDADTEREPPTQEEAADLLETIRRP